MDEIVLKAMAKWPDVPDCYGWLSLDARGQWRMHNEYAQAHHLPGDRISHAPLLAFIARNYACDDSGRWYFQNGPQRVFVDLAATPYIAHTDPALGFTLHTGEPVPWVDSMWLTDGGNLVLESAGKVAQLDDRDLADIIGGLRMHGQPASEDDVLAWMDGRTEERLSLQLPSRLVPLRHARQLDLARQFGYVQHPAAPD